MPSYIKSLKSNLGDLIIPRTTAKAVTYDNSTSGLNAIDAQDAIDELHSNQKQIIAPMQMPGYTTIVSSAGMSQSAYSTALSINNIQGNTVLGGIPAYDTPVTMESVESPLKLHISGKNLIDFSKAIKAGETVGVSYSISDNGAISLSGICERPGSYAYIMPFGDEISKAFYLPSGTYYLSGLNTDYSESRDVRLYLKCYNKLGESVVDPKPSTYGPDGVEFAIPGGGAWITVNIAIKDGTDVTDVTITPQIEVGSEFTDYEEPSNTTVEIPLIGKDGQSLEPLRMSYIGYVTTKAQNPDCIVLKNGVWYVKRTTTQLDLTNATWVKGSSYFAIKMDGKAIPGAQSRFVLCTHFPGSGEMPDSAGIWCGSGLALQNTAVPADTTNEWMAEFCAEQAQAGTPVTVVYSLLEPIYEELHQDVQNILNTLTAPIDVCSVWFEGEVAPTADIGIPRGDFPSENARALAMTRADRTLSNLTDYQKALYNIGGRPNRSLVVNGVFRNPVNQQGKNEYRNPVGGSDLTTLDRWIAERGVNVFYNDGMHLGITRDEGTGNALRQNISEEEAQQLVGKNLTVSILTISGDLAFATGTVNPLTEDTIIMTNVNNIGFGLRFFAEAKSYQIGRLETSGGDIVAVKVEIGNIQTLAYKDSNGTWQLFEENNFGETLARCQRYGLFSGTSDLNAVPLSIGQAFLPTPVTMRAKPVIVGTPVVYNADTNSIADGAIVSIIGVKQNGVVLQISGLSAPERSYVLFPTSTGLSAEL